MTNRILAIAAAAAIASATAYAADIVIEAENPTDNLQWLEDSKNSEGSEVSQGKGLKIDDVQRQNLATYRFEAPEAGTYNLDVYYITCNTRWIELKVNGGRPMLFRLDQYTPNWDGKPDGDRSGVAAMSMKVNCEAGENILEMRAVYGPDEPFSPTVDRFELTRAEVDEELPQWNYDVDRITVECEDYHSKSGSASDSNKGAFSQGKGLGFGNNAGEATYKVAVSEEGAYLLQIAYATLQDRWITVRANKQNLVQEIKFAKNSQDWGNNAGEWLGYRSVIVYLEAGENTLRFGQLNGYSPDLDYFTLDRVDLSYSLERPATLLSMPKASLADVARWTAVGVADLAAVRDHNEFTGSDIAAGASTVTLELPAAAFISGYSIATDSASDGWAVEVSADGETWTELAKDFREVAEDDNVKNYVLNNRSEAVGFIRLVMTGEENTTLADFAVFGNFESPLEGGLIPVGHSDFESTHPGFDSGWGEVVANLFDGNVNRQFTVAEGGDGSMGDADDIAVTVYLAEELPVASYLLATHNSTGYYKTRSPREWTLEAFDYEANDWRTVSDCSGMDFVAPASSLIMAAEPAATSDTWRLTIKNRRGKATHLSMFQLYADNKLDVEEKDNGGTTSVAEAAVAATVAVSGNVVSLTAANSAYTVYSVSGSVVATGIVKGSVAVELPAGLYIVRLGGKACKVAVR